MNSKTLILTTLLLPAISLAQTGEFIPLVNIPGLNNPDQNFNEYINALYAISISIAALLAVIKIIIAGVKWMLSDSVSSISQAKSDIQGALIGLLIVISAVLILNVINPSLTSFEFELEPASYVPSTVTSDVAPTPEFKTCSSIAECDALKARCISPYTVTTFRDPTSSQLLGNNFGYVTCSGPFGPGGGTDPGNPIAEVDYCQEVYGANMPTHPSFTAWGFEKVEVPFEEIWGVTPGNTASSKGVPGIFVDPIQGRYLAIPFTMTSDSGDSLSHMRMSWVETQPRFGEPTLDVGTGRISFTISPCPGDFRPRDNSGSDPFLTGACRISAADISGNMNVSANVPAAGLSGCRVTKGKTAYINIATYDMFGTSAPSATNCPIGATTCGVSLRLP